jgi:hypothetical protein
MRRDTTRKENTRSGARTAGKEIGESRTAGKRSGGSKKIAGQKNGGASNGENRSDGNLISRPRRSAQVIY